MTLLAVDATKTLRDRSKTIEDRARLAGDIINGTVEIYLPRKTLVILEWIFSGITSDPNARTSSQMWKLLVRVWDQVDLMSRRKVFSGFQIADSVALALDSLSKSPDENTLDAIAVGLETMTRDCVVSVSTPAEASKLVVAYLKNVQKNDKLSSVIWKLVKTKPITFDDPACLSDILREPLDEARTKYLKDFLSKKDHPVVPLHDPGQAAEVLDCVVKSHVNVEERFNSLITTYPTQAAQLLDTLVGCEPMPSLESVLSGWFKEKPDWGVLQVLLKLEPKLVFDKADAIFSALDSSFDDSFAVHLLQRAVQFRRLIDILPLWRDGWLDRSDTLQEALVNAVSTLSSKQVSEILNTAPLVLIRTIKFEVAADPIVSVVLGKLLVGSSTWNIRRAILDVLPTSADKVVPQEWFDEEANDETVSDKAECLLRLRELVDFDVRMVLPYGLSSKSIRFFRLYEHFGSSADIRELCSALGSTSAFTGGLPAAILECPRVLGALVEELLSGNNWSRLEMVPPAALANAEKLHQVLELAWSKGALRMCINILKFVPKLGKSLSAKQLVNMAGGVQESDVRLLKETVQLWLTDDDRKKDLQKALPGKSSGKWHLILLHALTGNYKEAVKYSLANSSASPAVEILSVVPSSPEVTDAAIQLALTQPSEPAFALICTSLKPQWKLVLAYHIWTDFEFGSTFKEYFENVETDILWLAAAEALKDRHYIALKDLSELFPTSDRRFTKLVTIACAQEVQCMEEDQGTSLSSISLDFFILVEEVLRERQWLITQPGLELILKVLASSRARRESDWMIESLALSRVLLFQRHRLQGRMHLIVAAMSSLLKRLTSSDEALQYVRLMNNLCNPSQQNAKRQFAKGSSLQLTSAVAQSRRLVAKYANALLLNHVATALSPRGPGPSARLALQPAAFALFDVLGNDALKGVTVLTDGPSRAYLRRLYEDYKAYGKWKAD